jgi:hypothetical protein
MKPGNLVNGIRKSNFGKTKLSQLSSPHNASSKPNQTSHFGNTFAKPAETDAPAKKIPSGTE